MALVRVTPAILDLDEHLRAVDDPRCGAVVTFIGQVRDHDPAVAREVTGIEYSAHPDADTALERIVSEAVEGISDGPVRIAISHRVGHLAVGDLALVVCVASAHRDTAYRVSRSVVERIKTDLPVWKKQQTADGAAHWAGL